MAMKAPQQQPQAKATMTSSKARAQLTPEQVGVTGQNRRASRRNSKASCKNTQGSSQTILSRKVIVLLG